MTLQDALKQQLIAVISSKPVNRDYACQVKNGLMIILTRYRDVSQSWTVWQQVYGLPFSYLVSDDWLPCEKLP